MQYNEYKEFISIEGLRKQVAISTMTRKEICEKAGISEDVLSALLLRSRNQLTTTENIARLAYALECKVDELVEFKGIKFDERYSMYSRLPKEPEAGLSYQPLWSMMFNEYGVGYKNKFEALFENVHSVSIKKMESDSYDSKSYKRKLNGNYPLTLPAIYEICRAFKCTPGCIFGCKGDYDWEKTSIKLPKKKGFLVTKRTLESKKITAHFGDNNTINVLAYKNCRIFEKKNMFSESDFNDYIGKMFIYGDKKEDLYVDNLPDELTMYPLEKIDFSLEKPFFINNEWRAVVRKMAENESNLLKILEGYYEEKYHIVRANISFYINILRSEPVYDETKYLGILEPSPNTEFIKSYKNNNKIQYYSSWGNEWLSLSSPNFCDNPNKYRVNSD